MFGACVLRSVVPGHVRLLSTWNAASTTGELSFHCYLMLFNVNSNWNSPLWLAATSLASTDLETLCVYVQPEAWTEIRIIHKQQKVAMVVESVTRRKMIVILTANVCWVLFFMPSSVVSTWPVFPHCMLTICSSGNDCTVAAYVVKDEWILDTQSWVKRQDTKIL